MVASYGVALALVLGAEDLCPGDVVGYAGTFLWQYTVRIPFHKIPGDVTVMFVAK